MLDESNDRSIEYEYLKHIKVDGSEESYFQYILLYLLGNKFALGWHANYDYIEILCDEQTVIDILSKKGIYYKFDNIKDQIINLDVIPKISISEKKVEVVIVIFSPWLGFIEKVFIIDKNNISNFTEKDRILIDYHCGIIF